MANEGGQPQGVSSLPLPPLQYINVFTDENVKNNRTPKPPPPIKDQYAMFGTQFHADDLIIRPLETQGFRRLYPLHFDHKRELKKLNQSILVNFLDILDILISAPNSQKRPEKIEDLTLLFIHMHHLINEFRPHQARETLRVMMEVQKHQRLETAERFQKQFNCVQEMLHNCLSGLPDDSELDTKLVIKTEREEPVVVKQEKAEPAEEEEEPGCSIRDQMMCDIVDAMN